MTATRPSPSTRTRAALWAGAALATLAAGWGAGRAGLPGGYLFAAILVGLAIALALPGRLALPPLGFRGAQAVTGVVIGTYLEASTLAELGPRWVAVALVTAGTLVVTLAAGLLLARIAPVDRATASLGLVAGGASGIVAMSDDLGADDRLVAFMQYLRVLIVVLLTPLLVSLAFSGSDAGQGGGAAAGPLLGSASGWAMTAGIGVVGALGAPFLRLPSPAIMGPLLLATVLTLLGLTGGEEVPALLREVAFALIGLHIGLGFDRAVLRSIARLVMPVLLVIAALVLACFGLAVLLSLSAEVSLLNAYLATTPGGLFAVLPLAFGAGADTTFVLVVQGLRVLVMVLVAPAMVRALVGRAGRVSRAEDV